ncbi:MAG: hypothetical protein NTY48_07150 [Candidatus Diapherotrites archaeon]|nr:hypothetical protein [Candidatus Diapherotrites archaeon]
MLVRWGMHAKQRFLERVLMHGLDYGDFEFKLNAQVVKIREGNLVRTIFEVNGIVFTVIKEETTSYIEVITMWESNKKEVDLWKNR